MMRAHQHLQLQMLQQLDENAANLTATVTLSGVSSQTITVAYATADGTATATADYSATTGTLTFNPNETSQTISIPILADTIDEANETFTVALSSPTNATVSSSSGTATMTITDDDVAPTISINDVSTTLMKQLEAPTLLQHCQLLLQKQSQLIMPLQMELQQQVLITPLGQEQSLLLLM